MCSDRCVGLGDSFDLTITAIAGSAQGRHRHEGRARSPPCKDSYYIRRVRAALHAEHLRRISRSTSAIRPRKLLEQPREDSPLYKQELADFDLGEVRVTPEALVLEVEFKLVVKVE